MALEKLTAVIGSSGNLDVELVRFLSGTNNGL